MNNFDDDAVGDDTLRDADETDELEPTDIDSDEHQDGEVDADGGSAIPRRDY